MPKLILFVVFLIIFAVFAAFNTQQVEINYLLGKGNVALVVALVISFTLGVLVTLPIVLFGRARSAKRAEQKVTDTKAARGGKKAGKGADESGSSDAGGENENPDTESSRGKISLK